jgi:hypothetical protein
MSTADDLFPGRTTLGGRRTARPIGGSDPGAVDERSGLTGPPRGTRVADLAKKPVKSRKPPARSGAKSAGREITVISSFKNPFKGPADEIQAMKQNRWEPSTDDFRAVAGNAVTIDHFHQLFAAILVDGAKETKAGSIGRINIFTHANSDMIAFSGSISSSGAMASVSLKVDGSITPGDLQSLTQGQTFNVNSTNKAIASKWFSLADVRGRFAKDAIIVVYACKSGLDSSFVQEIADTFQVKVQGFNDLIGYFPEYDDKTNTIKRRRTGVGRNAAVVTGDFHDMDKSNKAVVKTPKAGGGSSSVKKTVDDDE